MKDELDELFNRDGRRLPRVPISIIIAGVMLMLTFFRIEGVVKLKEEWKEFKVNALPAKAVITDTYIHEGSGKYSTPTYRYYVNFTDNNGVEHDEVIERYIEGAKVGSELTVYYDKNDPGKLMVEPSAAIAAGRRNYLVLLGLGVGAVAIEYMIRRRNSGY